jgi:hypothetical protein
MDTVLSSQGRQDSSAGILIRLQARLSTNRLSIPDSCRRFLSSSQLLHSLQFSRCLFPRVKPTSRDDEDLPPPRAGVKNLWSPTSIPLYFFMAWFLNHMEYFIILHSTTLWQLTPNATCCHISPHGLLNLRENLKLLMNSGVPRNFFRGVQQIQLRTEDRENADLGAVAP